MSYGTITVLKKDGLTEGSSVDIKKDITIGSSHPAHIRIKSPNMIAEHAKIVVDENGKCSLVALTNKNMPKVNGIQIQDACSLHNGDKVYMGGRIFIFKCTASCLSQVVATDTPDKQGGEIEYGRLIQLKRTGEEGTAIKILGDILIGSRPPANICIKSSLVAKEHVRITIDSRKNCQLVHVSSMFPPKVNGISKRKSTLRHGDTISIADRTFLFQQPTRLFSSPVKQKRTLHGALATLSYGLNSPSRSTPTAAKDHLLHGKNTSTSTPSSFAVSDGAGSIDICDGSGTNKKGAEDEESIQIHQYSSKGGAQCSRVLSCDLDSEQIPAIVSTDDDFTTSVTDGAGQLTSSMLRALRNDTAALLPDGRPSMDTMTAQWEFMRDQFLGNSDEALQWMMLAKNGGVDAYRHAHRKVRIAEEQYYKSLYDIDLLERKQIVVAQLKPILQALRSHPADANVAALSDQQESLRKLLQGNMRGVCSKQLDGALKDLVKIADLQEISDMASSVCSSLYVDEMKVLKERLQAAQIASEESLSEMEKWSEREKQTTEYAHIKAAEENAWLMDHCEENQAALEEMRKLIPTNITELSTAELSREIETRSGLYSIELLAELKNNRILHWIVTHPEDIMKSNFLAGEQRQYFMNIECLDVVEMRAIRLCLPERFEHDKDGQKAEWRERFLCKLKQMVSQDCEEVVRGGWDPECGRRAMVAMPPLRDEQKRRSVYFYKTHNQLTAKLQQLKQRDSQLSVKEAQLACDEESERVCRKEYETILEESRDPAYKALYGSEKLLEAKEHAKRDLMQAEGKRRRTFTELQRIQSLIKESTMTKESLVDYIVQHAAYLGSYEWDKVEVLVQIMGVFEPCPEICKIERVNAKFVTAEEEAENRKNEISAIKREATPVLPSTDAADAACARTPRMKRAGGSILESTDSELVSSLNKVLRSAAIGRGASNVICPPVNICDKLRDQPMPASAGATNKLVEAAANRPIRSKYLKKIVSGHNAEDEVGAAPANCIGRSAAPLSFLDQIKTATRKPGSAIMNQENGPPNFLKSIKDLQKIA